MTTFTIDKLTEKKLGFGCMRLPYFDNEANIDLETFSRMVDTFIKRGFNYFDTAYSYHDGQSEVAIRECLVKRYPREQYILVDKMPTWLLKEEKDLEKFFQIQLERCGVDYFDIYFMHNMGVAYYDIAKRTKGFDFLRTMKAEGKTKYIGFSFHDKPEVLEAILNDNPDVDIVQIQLNYVDYDNPTIQSGNCLKVLQKYHKPAVIMETIKGGSLINLPSQARDIYDQLGATSYADYALRFAAEQENVITILSGMSTYDQLEENTRLMNNPMLLSDKEKDAIRRVVEIINNQSTIPCTSCRYCIDDCPRKILIPDLFSIYNQLQTFGEANYPGMHYRKNSYEIGHGRAGDCIKCGKCETHCPQHLPIRNLLEKVSEHFDQK